MPALPAAAAHLFRFNLWFGLLRWISFYLIGPPALLFSDSNRMSRLYLPF
jgi:hypothetical protein